MGTAGEERIDCAVIGAGVIGLAVARAIARAGCAVLVLEAAEAPGTMTSSRNSEVIHAGIYYERGSLKATSCVAGRRKLYAYCEQAGVPHRRCGKLIVATDDAQVERLAALKRRAEANGVDDLAWLDGPEAREREPALHCVAALHSPSTGVVDSHQLMVALRRDAEEAGASVVCRSPVEAGSVEDDGVRLEIGGRDPVELLCARVVNSAGLAAQAVARTIVGLDASTIPQGWFAKGNYFTLRGTAPFRHLIYPMPDAEHLGVHLTLDLAGQARFGPDVEWVQEPSYDVDAGRAAAFYPRIRGYWPGLPDHSLQAGYAGVRPKLVPPGSPPADFVVQGPVNHGVPGLVNLYGIESPGLTSALALADEVVARLGLESA